jgi:cytochrome c oxidase accessory protein FixG
VLFYGFATYGNAGYMREQVCKFMCPYARFQSAMFDKDTLIISYDVDRGEPRGSRGRKVDAKALGLGACIDCSLCVHVCPTGIDIRKGLQYECIGCAACIDVCDSVMDKMNYPRGLVRYDTQNGLDRHLTRDQMLRRMLRPRVLIYSAVLIIISGALLASLLLRATFRVDVVRDRSSLARIVDDGYIENVYRLQLMNATEAPQRFQVTVAGMPEMSLERELVLDVQAADSRWVTASVRVPPLTASQAGAGAHPIAFHIQREATGNEPSRSVVEKSTFVVPR